MPPTARRRRRLIAITTTVVLATLVWMAAPYARTARFLAGVTGQPGWLQPIVSRAAVGQQDVEVPTRYGNVPARMYRPNGAVHRAVLVVPGVHAGGVDEPRLDALARRLAETGAVVLSVPLPDLRRFLITPASTDQLEDAAVWMSANRSLAPTGRITLLGVSFGGGLAVVAAGRPSLDGRLTSVVSIGGHGDLPRVLTFLCTGRLANGATLTPHDYGVAVLLFGAVDRLVPLDQRTPLADAVREFLVASSLHDTAPDDAAKRFADLDRRSETLPDPSRSLLRLVLARDVPALGATLLPLVETLAGDPALSPERSPAPSVPVFLLHGATDNVIPSLETTRLAASLEASGRTRVRALVTPAFSHADVSAGLGLLDAWALLRFWREALAPGGD